MISAQIEQGSIKGNFTVKLSLQKIIFLYLVTVVGILIFSSVAKVTASYSVKELEKHDPFLFFLTVKQLLILATATEISVAVIILLNLKKSPQTGLVITIWMTLLLLGYRFAFAFSPEHLNVDTICKCFGGAGGILGKYSDKVAWLLLGYLLFAGLSLFIALLRQNRQLKLTKTSLNVHEMCDQST